jgi:HAD superfamily, subfamily IIIB (Acid phosphatase)
MIAPRVRSKFEGDTDMPWKVHGRDDHQPAFGLLRRSLAGSALAGLLTFAGPAVSQAYDCPAVRQPNIPTSEEPAANIDKHKKQLRAYHTSGYDYDIKLVLDDALAYVQSRADKVTRPAVVLDIDETSLTNWPSVDADDFGFIGGGECPLRPTLPCGFSEWINKAQAKAIGPTLNFYNAMREMHVAVFFITGRRQSQRQVTIRNLRRAGFENWAGLMTRPDDDKAPTIVPFKSGERGKIEAGDKPYTIIATIGDQQSDLDGGHAECAFKVPNPFYFID